MEFSAQELWEKALKLLRETVPQKVFEMWFSCIRPLKREKDKFFLEVGNELHRIWIKENYEGYIVDALKR